MSFIASLFGSTKQEPATMKTPLDMVTFAAGLVSNPGSIDTMLDTVRRISADLQPGQQPSSGDTQTLLGVYLQIEQYLATKEPLRSFTKEELRQRLPTDLRAQVEAYETNHKE